jgi:lysophospholipase L1-like esterase
MAPSSVLSRRLLLKDLCAGLGATAMVPARAAEPAEEARLHSDWPYLARYADENARLRASGALVEVIFLGDSITENWPSRARGFFTAGRVGRGIGGQTTPQLMLRFRPDVVALRPRMVHIMGGTNDIAGNTGPSTLEMIKDNVLGMTEMALANGICPIFASVPPAREFRWRPGLDTITPIAALNAWLKEHAEQVNAPFADYFAVMNDGSGGMRPGFAYDGVHPTEHGYAAMRPVAEKAFQQASRLRADPDRCRRLALRSRTSA